MGKVFSVILVVIFCLYLVVLVLAISGCRSINTVTSGSIIEHSNSLAELKARNQQLDDLFSEFRTDITAIGESAGKAGSNIDVAIRLFDEYNKRVQRLIDDYDTLQRQVGSASEDTR